MTRHYLLYGHGGSLNHGGEALARTTIALLRQISPGCRITLSSHFPEQDMAFGIDVDEFIGRNLEGRTHQEIYAATFKAITPDSICIHLGGDNYCYRNWQRYAAVHAYALKRGAASVLWSCSIDPEGLDGEMLSVLRTHHLITARENITYRALCAQGLANVAKVSDIAFTLEPAPVEFPLRHFVALNLSPLTVRKNPLLQKAFQGFVDYLLDKTDFNVALVPHVLAAADNDYEALKEIDTRGGSRILLVSGRLSAAQYKYIISKACFGIFARTHAAIAAYASLVPTLAVGYSVKSRGIAGDLGMGEFVINVEEINNAGKLIELFQKLRENETQIRGSLKKQMPRYVRSAVDEQIIKFLR